jgi:hypothetical protein
MEAGIKILIKWAAKEMGVIVCSVTDVYFKKIWTFRNQRVIVRWSFEGDTKVEDDEAFSKCRSRSCNAEKH